MSTSDPRSRIVLHMNWNGQTLPVLLNGLGSKNTHTDPSLSSEKPSQTLPQPTHDQIVSISPLAQISRGNYRTPTFFIHGTEDDLIPWQQTQRSYHALVSKRIAAGIAVLHRAKHLFDLYPTRDEEGWQAVLQGYEFLKSHV